ncbi:MAG: hypothetical protein JKY48_04060 [Flavobacteriales bacterium]|nr:hypothetical protein [Flavobacteriales bacterium]
MRNIFALLAFFLSSMIYGQDIRVEFGYSNLYSKQFDQLIKTYNFSRPFLQEQQPLLSHGFHSGLSYLFKSEKVLKSGINLNYSLIRSRAKNKNLDVKLAFNMLELGYFLNYHNKDKFGDFYSELGLNLVLGLLSKRHNNQPYLIDDKKVRSFQAGISLNFNIGYMIELNDKYKILPFVDFHYSPYFMEGQSEVVINQTSDLIEEQEQYSSFLKFFAGLRFYLSNKKVANNSKPFTSQ